MRFVRVFVATSLVAMFSASCGYRLIGTQVKPPGGIRSISIGTIENRSREFGLDKALVFAFEREFFRRGLIRLDENPDSGEAVLSGTIQQFVAQPVAYDSDDSALQYQAELVLDFELKRRSDGVVLWKTRAMREIDDFSVVSRIVVPSTAAFQQGVTSVADLQKLTDIQLAESSKRQAIERLTNAVVRDVHDRILEDF